MGHDKALLAIEPGGKPMLALVLDRLREVADDVTIVSTPRPGYDAFGIPVVPDVYPSDGALGGIASALHHAVHEHCLVVACDMPFLSPTLLRLMVQEPRDYDVFVPRLPGKSRQGDGLVYQTLHAIFSQDCREPIARQLAAGNRQVISFFPSVRVRTLDEAAVRGVDPHLLSFFNANTPAAAQHAAALAHGARGPEAAQHDP
jgi:molybdopterin-guanine dinucleotide biosynthesis protein A